MSGARKDIEHEIWVTAYLRALREHSARDAETEAIDAIRRYQDRWNAPSPEPFVALSHCRADHASEDYKVGEIVGLSLDTLYDSAEFACDDASKDLERLERDSALGL